MRFETEAQAKALMRTMRFETEAQAKAFEADLIRASEMGPGGRPGGAIDYPQNLGESLEITRSGNSVSIVWGKPSEAITQSDNYEDAGGIDADIENE